MEKILSRNYSDKYQQKMLESFNARLELYLFNLAKLNKPIKELFNKEEFLGLHINPEYKDEKLKYKCGEYGASFSLNDESMGRIDYKMDVWCEENEELIKNIYDNDYIAIYMDEIFPKDIFEEKMNSQICHYCHITINEIIKLLEKRKIYRKTYTRGLVMELDRKIPNWEYDHDNTVPCCYWCNNAKTDEFFDDEFVTIGIKIGEVLKARL